MSTAFKRRPSWLAGLLALGICLGSGLPLAAAAGETPRLEQLKARYRRPEAIPSPKSNPFTPEKAELGRMLFFDPRLSGSNAIACASCHHPGLDWTDGLPRGVGHGGQTLPRRTPTLLDLAWGAAFMWDGRAATLESQALLPLTSPNEMNTPAGEVAGKLQAIRGYREPFAKAFPEAGISEETITAALATFERTITSPRAPFDAWIEGDEGAIPEAAKRGFLLFDGKARCSKCHAGWRFTDDSFHDIGLASADLGRGEHVPPAVTIMQHAFKTPTLRNVTLRQGAYMHDGSLADLDAVLEHYVKGGIRRPSLSPELQPVDLGPAERADLIAFLATLAGPPAEIAVPVLPR
jgi:cytochrome c peroxidase